ncbi:THAP-type domain-containing protein [Caerostris extrusa]|uniref:THAP-type domain-containing protein n=1 Tax=Caerostris extrusa TaxID=172846 RepID=A0AAV4PP47_CAEEX|nr:THAP-type domain-containing protein [Caerostris extrusa]
MSCLRCGGKKWQLLRAEGLEEFLYAVIMRVVRLLISVSIWLISEIGLGVWLKSVVPCFRSNYDPTVYISCFQFPKEEGRRNLWLKKINRKDYSPSNKNAVVCIKHFSEKFVITEDHAVRDDGSVLTVKRIYPKLTTDAYPSIIPNQPAYLSSDPVSKRKTPSERRNEILKRDEKNLLTGV